MSNEVNLDIKPLTGSCGAEVFGVDIAKPLSDSTVAIADEAAVATLPQRLGDCCITP